MFDRLGQAVSRHWRLIIAVWVLAAVALHLAAPRFSDVTHDGDLEYLPPTTDSVAGERLLREAFPQEAGKSQLVLLVERPDGPLSTEDLVWSDSLAELFRAHA